MNNNHLLHKNIIQHYNTKLITYIEINHLTPIKFTSISFSPHIFGDNKLVPISITDRTLDYYIII